MLNVGAAVLPFNNSWLLKPYSAACESTYRKSADFFGTRIDLPKQATWSLQALHLTFGHVYFLLL